jgi:protein CpxP
MIDPVQWMQTDSKSFDQEASMNRFSTVAAGVLVATLVAGTSAFAQGPGRGPGHRGGRAGGAGLPLAQLELTDQQRQQVRDIHERSRDATQPLNERLQQARLAQQQAIEASPVDEARIRAAAQELADAQTELAVHRAKLRAEVFEVLTPAQREQAAKLSADRRARMSNRAQVRERRQRNR